MEYAPHTYDNDDAGQFKDSKRFLIKMKKINGNKMVDSAVDIGTGVGNVTKMIADQMPCSSMVGIDVDSEMVRYATAKYPDLVFRVADCGSSWPQFKQSTGIPEKSVDLIVSTYAMHWLFTHSQRMNAMNNVKKMLKNGGQGHFLFTHQSSISYLCEEYLMKSRCTNDTKNSMLENGDKWRREWTNVCLENNLNISSFDVSRIQFEAKYSFLAVLFRWHLRLSRECIYDDEKEPVNEFLQYCRQKAEKGIYKCSHYEISQDTVKFDIDMFELHVEKID
ncbi:putative methyltransferase 235L [Halotydeus destructor]|nr:putative methyltransferase 235L [Halotydeus destructor]